ncbi:MAG: protein translocase subunit SecF [Clostridia bacterium]
MKTLNFMKFRKITLVFSFLIIAIGITTGFVKGFKFDIDFKGGTTIQADLNEEFDNNKVSDLVKNITGSVPLIQKMTGGKNMVSITMEPVPTEVSDRVVSKLKTVYQTMAEPSTKNIQPSYGKELVESALLALAVAIVLMLLYIGIRFKSLGFNAALTAILALVHDALVIISIYAIFQLPINSTFVAVLLTIIGYSINDTIIVYDRIRENKRKANRSLDLKDTINLSLTQTLRRTIYTSFTTIIAILIVYIFAYFNNQTVLKEFSLPLIIGIITGTYSSIFIASSLLYSFDNISKKIFKKGKKK